MSYCGPQQRAAALGLLWASAANHCLVDCSASGAASQDPAVCCRERLKALNSGLVFRIGRCQNTENRKLPKRTRPSADTPRPLCSHSSGLSRLVPTIPRYPSLQGTQSQDPPILFLNMFISYFSKYLGFLFYLLGILSLSLR